MTASTLSNFTKLVLPAALLGGTVFSVLTAPLALYGSDQVVVRLKNERIFDDRLKDVAAPYIGFASLVGLGAGAACIAIVGWQQANRKAQAINTQLSALQQQLQAKEAQVEGLLLSDARLTASGLGFFLQDDVEPVVAPVSAQIGVRSVATPMATQMATPPARAQLPVVSSAGVKRSPAVAIQTASPVIESLVFGTDALALSQPGKVGNSHVQSVVSPLAAAQVFIGLTRANQAVAVSKPAPKPAGVPVQSMTSHGRSPVAKLA